MQSKLQILHLEDNAKDAELIRETLLAGGIECQIKSVETSGDFESSLKQGGWDIILCDYKLSAFDGITALSMVKKVLPDVPFIMVSGVIGEEGTVEALKLGAADFVLKDHLSPRLGLAVRRAMDEVESKREQAKLEEQMRWTQKMEVIGQLAAGIVHEINSPVGFISSNMEVLQGYIENYTKILEIIDNLKKQIKDGDIEKARSTIAELNKFEEEINLDYIRNDVNKLLEHSGRGLTMIKKIVMSLKTFSRGDNTELIELVKIEEVIGSILDVVQNEIKYKAVLSKDYANTPLIKGNAQRLGQVFINLLVNASQAIEEKGGITIKTYQQDKFVCIDVVDTGKGIPPETLKKIFDPFFTTKPVGQGTGLGLSVSYDIIKKHGGEIRVRSKVGEGTTFTVTLPSA